MAFTTNQLISGAYFASGVVSREFETVSGSQLNDGLGWLNDILTEKRVDEGMVPYETKYTFNAIAGQEIYFIPNLTKIDTLVFYLDQVRYAMVYTQRNQYFGVPRVENILSLPFEWYWERVNGGGNLYIYFKPDRNYPMEIHGIFELNPVILGEDLTLNTTVANLGLPTIYGRGDTLLTKNFSLSPGQFVVNTVDLSGFYDNLGAFINHINTGVIPNVIASLDNLNNFSFISTMQSPAPITIQTTGFPPFGTRFKGTVAADQFAGDLGAIYNNGDNGIGATLTSPVPAVLIVDGYTVQFNDRVLVLSQTDPAQNGVYTLTTVGTGLIPWVLTRSPNYNVSADIQIGDIFTVLHGAVAAGLSFVQTQNVDTIGLSPIRFDSFSTITFENFSTIDLPFEQIYIANGFDQFYITYLRYALADRICSEYNYDTPPNVMRQLAKYESWIASKSRVLDLEMKKASTLQKRGSFNWAFVNLGKGWMRPS